MHLLGLSLTYDLYLGSLLPPEGYLVSDYLIFNRIPERGIEDNLHLVALHKAHLYYSLTETAVTVNLHDHSALTRLKFRQSHCFPPCYFSLGRVMAHNIIASRLAADNSMNVMSHPACSATNPISILASTADPKA